MEDTIVIFFPFDLKNIDKCYLKGEFETFDVNSEIFFITKIIRASHPRTSVNLFTINERDGNDDNFKSIKNWVYIEIIRNKLCLKQLKIHGHFQNLNCYRILWINYDFHIFSQIEVPLIDLDGSSNSYIDLLKRKIVKLQNDKTKVSKSCLIRAKHICLDVFNFSIVKLTNVNLKKHPVTKYLNIALHVDNYLKGFLWAVKTYRKKEKLDIKLVNFLLSVFLDMLLGIFFLNWLNSKVSLDSFSTIFLLMIETVVNSIKNLIVWLRGDPAGLKLNWAFNKVLGTFFSFHIDIWWTFIDYMKPLVNIVFQIFLILGHLGITFQASILCDLLALVSFHVYCIYAYAAKLYSIQISSIISLCRLFLGRKENPFRKKVDSCRYSPEQLFVGTLGFTILLFLLPTTLLYYTVFTSIRLSILMIQGILNLIRYLNQTLPVYSTALWLLQSPKIFLSIEMMHYDGSIKSENSLLLTVKPVRYTWWETVKYFMPDCVGKPSGVDVSSLLSSLINGKLIYPI